MIGNVVLRVRSGWCSRKVFFIQVVRTYGTFGAKIRLRQSPTAREGWLWPVTPRELGMGALGNWNNITECCFVCLNIVFIV